MKNIFYILLLLPTIIFAQYPSNSGHKITLGEQTTADGLVYRGLAADTTRKPSIDTMAYIILDTATNIQWQYKKATSNAWLRIGGSISSGLTGTLPVANGGTGLTTFSAADRIPYTTSATALTTSSNLTFNGSKLILTGNESFTGTQSFSNNEINSTYTQTTATNAGVVGAFNSLLTYAGTAPFSNSRGYSVVPTVTNTNTSNLITGAYYSIRTGSSGAANILNALLSEYRLGSSGNVTDAKLISGIIVKDGTGTLTNGYGFKIEDITNTSGTITNTFGIHVGDITSGTQTNKAYSLYISDINTRSYLNGSVGFGVLNPTAYIHLAAGTATASTAPLKFTSGTNLTAIEQGAMEFSLFNGANRLFISPDNSTRKEIGYADLSNVSGTLPLGNGGTGSSTKNFVDLTTTQTVAGAKTFTGNLQAQGLGFYSINSAFGQPEIEIPELSDLFWRADKRFTLTGFPGNPAAPFAGSFATDYPLPLNTVTTMNINVAGKEGIPVNGLIYGEGHLYISFYSSSNNYDSISVSVKRSGVWTKCAEPINLAISGGYKVLKFIITSGTNLTDFEIKIGVGSSSVWISSINFISNRYGGQELPFVSKYTSDNNLFGLLNMRTNTGADNVILSGTGNSVIGLVSGNLGVGIAAPTAKLHLDTGTTTVAPLKFTSGTNLTTAEAGAMEFNGTNLFFSPSTTRHTVNHGLTGSATLDFPSTLTMLSADLTITVTGAADGDVVSLGVPNAAVNANTFYSAWVSSANTVTVRFNNYSVGTVNPSSALFKVFVTK